MRKEKCLRKLAGGTGKGLFLWTSPPLMDGVAPLWGSVEQCSAVVLVCLRNTSRLREIACASWCCGNFLGQRSDPLRNRLWRIRTIL